VRDASNRNETMTGFRMRSAIPYDSEDNQRLHDAVNENLDKAGLLSSFKDDPNYPHFTQSEEQEEKPGILKRVRDWAVGEDYLKYEESGEIAKALNALQMEEWIREGGGGEEGKIYARDKIAAYGGMNPWMDIFAAGVFGTEPEHAAAPLVNKWAYKATNTLGVLSGAALMGAGVAPRAASGAIQLGRAYDLGARTTFILTSAAGGAATLAGKSIIDIGANIIEGKDISIMDATTFILSSAGYGAAFGTAGGAISSPFIRMPTEAAMGYVSVKLQGGSDEDAAFMALTFTALGFMNSKHLGPAKKEFALGQLKNEFVLWGKRRWGAEKEPIIKDFADKYISEVRNVKSGDVNIAWLDRTLIDMKNDAGAWRPAAAKPKKITGEVAPTTKPVEPVAKEKEIKAEFEVTEAPAKESVAGREVVFEPPIEVPALIHTFQVDNL